MYALCRVYLIYYLLRTFGRQRGQSALATFLEMRLPCQLGTGAMGLVNLTWLITGVRSFLRRGIQDAGKKGA